MQVRLTEAGRKLFDKPFSVINVSTARAFALMNGGNAAKDKNFMEIYSRNNPKKTVASKKTVVERPKVKPKIETATSKKARKREKAVMPKSKLK